MYNSIVVSKRLKILYYRITIGIPTKLFIADLIYHIARKFDRGKFGEFGKSLMICQTKIIQISAYNCVAKCLKSVNSLNFPPAKLSCYVVLAVPSNLGRFNLKPCISFVVSK